MSFLKGKTAIITGAGYAVLSDGRCGSIGYGIATAYAKEGIRGLSRVARQTGRACIPNISLIRRESFSRN